MMQGDMPQGAPVVDQNMSQGMDERRRMMLAQMLAGQGARGGNPWGGAMAQMANLAPMLMPANGGAKTMQAPPMPMGLPTGG